MNDYNPIGLAIPIFLVFMLLEYSAARLKGVHLHRYNDSVNSISMGLCLLVSDALLKTLTFTVFIYLYNSHRLFDFAIGDWVTWVVFFLGVDLCYYWFHRCAHEFNILWGAHVGHHQSEEFNLTTALRQSAFQYGFSWVFYLPLALLGCPPEVFLAQFALLKLYQFWLHTRLINRIPLLEGIFSTPSSHRVHHAKNPMYIDRNYGGTLVIWDRMFGSWQPEVDEERCHYGTTHALNTLSPITANLQHWGMLARDTWHTKSWLDKGRLWFKPTGWRPEDCVDSSHAMTLQHTGTEDRAKYNPKAGWFANLYAAISLLSISALALMFIFRSPILEPVHLAGGVFTIVGGVIVLNQFLENRYGYWFIELFRWPLMLLLTWQLALSGSATEVVNTITINRSADQVYDYVSNPSRWKEWHFQSLSVTPDRDRSLKIGESFDEVIHTPLGEDDLEWAVAESSRGIRWGAFAYNPAKNVNIQLRYNFRSVTPDQTEFTRILNYDMPNFFWYAVNEVYFEPQVSGHSQQALEALKAKLEGQ